MELKNISSPSDSVSSKICYIIDLNKYLVSKLTHNWSHLFFEPERRITLKKNEDFDDIFDELRLTFSSEEIIERKMVILNKNGLNGTILEMKIQLLQQLFTNFQDNASKSSLQKLMGTNILILKSLGNVFSVFDAIIELIVYLDSLLIKNKSNTTIN